MDVTQQRMDDRPTPNFQASPGTFDPELALQRCFESHEMVNEMIRLFFEDSGEIFQQMRAALARGDLAEVGRQGHRLKGTVVYLGANAASEAALQVESFATSNGGTTSEAKLAVETLERECKALQAALRAHATPAAAIEP